jgi:hypothetical protein
MSFYLCLLTTCGTCMTEAIRHPTLYVLTPFRDGISDWGWAFEYFTMKGSGEAGERFCHKSSDKRSNGGQAIYSSAQRAAIERSSISVADSKTRNESALCCAAVWSLTVQRVHRIHEGCENTHRWMTLPFRIWL